jgi:hypothetical protein
LKKKTRLSELMDRSFLPAKARPVDIDLKRMPEVLKKRGETP